jgi:hypothetical protein
MTNLTTHPSAANRKDTEVLDTCPTSYRGVNEAIMGNIQRPETPISHHTSGIHLPHDQSPKSLGELETFLDIDISSSTDSYIDKVIELLTSDGGLFPDLKLLIAPSEHLCQDDTNTNDYFNLHLLGQGFRRVPTKKNHIKEEVSLVVLSIITCVRWKTQENSTRVSGYDLHSLYTTKHAVYMRHPCYIHVVNYCPW